MSTVSINGKNFVINSTSSKIDKSGLITGTVRYLPKPAEYIEVGREGPVKGDVHPFDSRMTVETVAMEYTEAEAFLVATYTGLVLDENQPQPESDPDEERSVSVYSLDYGVSEEPIETHPDFGTFGGTATAPGVGAVFFSSELNKEATELDPETDANYDDKYQFSHFALGTTNAGVESYVDPGAATFTESYTTTKRPTNQLTGLGTIDVPTNAPALPGSRNWLYMGMSYEERGEVFSVTRTWRLSGPNGWNTDIY